MQYLSFNEYDVANGPGLRHTLFVSGCPHKCRGCFNPTSWNYDAGKEFNEETFEYVVSCFERDRGHIRGLSISGGDPFAQDEGDTQTLVRLIETIRQIDANYDIWAWTGYTLEQLLKNVQRWLLLKQVDVLVDGPFKESQKDLALMWRGSRNQVMWNLKDMILDFHENF